jgi:gas vesicle protein
MATLIDQVRVKAGRLIRVWNEERKKFSNAAPEYVSEIGGEVKGEKNNIRDQIENPISYVQKHAP